MVALFQGKFHLEMDDDGTGVPLFQESSRFFIVLKMGHPQNHRFQMV